MTEQVLLWLLIAVCLGFVMGRMSRPRANDQLKAIDRKVQMLTEHFELKWDPTVGVPENVLAQVRAGNKVEAIKLYREATGIGLKDAHERIEEIERRIRFRI